MSPAVAAVVALIVLVVAAELFSRRSRARLLSGIRANWGKPSTRERKMDAIAEYHRSIVEAEGAGGCLDDRTWSDLNLDEVFQAIDRTESTLGQQALYHRLRSRHDVVSLEAFEELVSKLAADAPMRERVQLALAGLQDPAGYDLWWLTRPDALDRNRWYILFSVWALAVLVALALIPVWPSAILIPVAGVAVNLFVRVKTAWRVSAVIGPFRQVSALIAAAETLAVSDLPRSITEPVKIELARLRRLRAIARWVGRDPSKSNELVAAFREYLNLLFLLDVNALYFAVGELRENGAALLAVIAAVGGVDAAVSVASLRAGTGGWVRPHFVAPGRPVSLADIRHPLVADAVPNSVALEPPHGMLVTGSNMSGKSTFLRTVGVTVVMAQTINTCLASGYAAPVFNVQSCIGRADDLIAGKSYYIVEVEEVLARVRASESQTPHLFLFDELFRGTNAVERIAVAEAVLRDLLMGSGRGNAHVVLAATHDAELVDLLRGEYSAYHFADSIGPDGLMFEYRLEPGPATTRNAIALLELHGAPQAVVRSALARAAELDRDRSRAVRPASS